MPNSPLPSVLTLALSARARLGAERGGLLIAGLISVPILLARGRGATLPLVPFLAAGALLACLAPARGAIGL